MGEAGVIRVDQYQDIRHMYLIMLPGVSLPGSIIEWIGCY
jgi:hypothetical protein